VIGGHRFKSISAAAYDHTCALEVGGAAYCWGYNNAGQLGDGTTADSGVGGPKAVIGGLLFTSISAGYDKTCGLVMGGKAYCWGDNGFGELGDGTILPSDTLGPREVIGGYLFNSIQSGGYHTCGISTLGRTLCWGDNTYGELGDGTLNPSAANGPQVVIGGLRFTSLGGNGYNTCALTRRGDAYCWGYNEFGDLGDGTRVTSGVSGPQPVL
jgi:alpha-tubulin suppressor-like RCC1 family protein